MTRLVLRTTLLACAALGALPAFAQTTDRDVIVVTGTALPAARETIGNAVTILDGEKLTEGGYRTVADALRQVPGLAINRTGALGALTQLRTRGAEGNHTLVLLDGVDLSAATDGEMDLSTLLTGDIDRIEVLRGPQSGLYGSNALAGVVNIITRKDIDGHYLGALAEVGEFDTRQFQASGGIGNGGDYLTAVVDYLTTDGYDVSTINTAVPSPALAGDPEDNEVTQVLARAGKRFTPNLRVGAVGRWVSKESGLDGQAFSGAISGRSFDDPSRSETEQFSLGVDGELTLMDGAWTTIASFARTQTEKAGNSFDFPSGFESPNGDVSARNRWLLQSTFGFGPDSFRSSLTGFAEHKTERFRNTQPFDPSQAPVRTRELNGFGVSYRAAIADQLHLSATARHDDNDAFEDADTWSLAGAWSIPSTAFRLHASYGVGVTNPSFFEQFGFIPSSYTGNPDLKPEESEGWDIGAEFTFSRGRIDVTYFEATLDNEITTLFGGPPLFLSRPVNSAAQSDREGVEVSFEVRPIDALDITGSYTWIDATEPAGRELRRPENQASLDAAWRLMGDRLRLNLGLTYNGEQYDTDFTTFMRTQMDAYTLLRFGAAYRLTDTVELFGRIENLMDEDYEEVIDHRGSPQAVYVGVRFRDGPAK